MAEETQFGKIRSFLWPIRGHELKKFIPMFVLFFLVFLNYHLLRITKDSLIITASAAGAEAIPFLKVWAMLPTAIIFVFFFTRLSNRFNRENIFYIMTSIFIGFFILFSLYFYPHRDSLCLNKTADFLQSVLPQGFRGFVAIIRYWMFSLFYVMAESWSNIMVSVMLWGFANDVTSVSEAKRYYALFGIGLNGSGILAGWLGSYLASTMTGVANNTTYSISSIAKFIGCKTPWDESFMAFMAIVIFVGIIVLGLYRYLCSNIFPEQRLKTRVFVTDQKMSLLDSFKLIVKDKYIMCIALIVLSYHIIINFTEVLWKSQISELFPNPAAYTTYFSNVTLWVGIIATLGSLFITGNVIRRLGWKITAYITPIIFIITSIGFFYFLFAKQYFPAMSSAIITIFGMTPLTLTVFFGSLQNCLGRSAKYTVYDATQQMAFIPLSQEDRIKGKAAIDGIGSRLGKSASSLIMQFLIISFSSAIGSSPYILVIMGVILVIWMTSLKFLGKRFSTMEEQSAA
jgi:AAA family ATP:ADP antiporter